VAVTTARAVGIVEPGGPEVMRVIERAVRDPEVGEVRIAVRAAAVNPTDVGLRERGAVGLPPPWVPGMDAAGVIESVGPGVERLAVGDEVMAAVSPRRPEGGAQSQLLVVSAASVAPVPVGASLEQASTLPMNGLTALRGLELLGLPAGAALLVSGGAGLLASYVIPLAKRAGLRVLADAGPADEESVRGLGADVVLPRGEALATAVREAAPGGVDAVFDTALLGRSVFPAIRDGGALAFVRTWDGENVEDGITIRPVWVGDVLERTEWLLELSRLAEQGVLVLRVAATFPPERAADAYRQLEAGGLRGRTVVVFD
jgi:NADPH2:quinone reductase